MLAMEWFLEGRNLKVQSLKIHAVIALFGNRCKYSFFIVEVEVNNKEFV